MYVYTVTDDPVPIFCRAHGDVTHGGVCEYFVFHPTLYAGRLSVGVAFVESRSAHDQNTSRVIVGLPPVEEFIETRSLVNC